MREIKQFAPDKDNTPLTTYLVLKTGGGSKREGLGRGIHWHIENKIEYFPTDPEEQDRLRLMNRILNDACLSHYELREGERVLDVGSGLGEMARAIARRTGTRVVAVERDDAQVEKARRLAEEAGESQE